MKHILTFETIDFTTNGYVPFIIARIKAKKYKKDLIPELDQLSKIKEYSGFEEVKSITY